MNRLVRPLALLTVATSLLLAGCGAVPGASAGPALTAQTVGGQKVVKLGFGAEGGEDPAVIRRADGTWAVAYVGTRVADRQLYVSTSKDGNTFSGPQAVEKHEFSDQSPSLVESANGQLHLFFTSNRNGSNFELFHTYLEADGEWAAAEQIDGFTGAQNVTVAYRGGRFMLAAEVTGEGLVVATRSDDGPWGERELVTALGFEPAVMFMPDGQAVVAYQRAGQIYLRTSSPNGSWSDEIHAAQGEDRLRTPALAWTDGRGVMVFTERTGDGYVLRRRHFDSELTFTDGPRPAALPGEARTPAVSYHNGKIGLAWGMKLTGGQQGIVFALAGDR